MKIKKTTLIPIVSIILLVLSPCIVNAGRVLSDGQSFEFEFDFINSSVASFDDPFIFSFFDLGGDILEGGESLIFSVFEDNTGQAAIRSTTIGGGTVGGFGYSTPVATAPWQDLQGVFRIEVITGAIELDSFKAATVFEGQYYEQTYAIPEPNSAALLLLGAGVFYLRRKRISKKRVELSRKTLADWGTV